MPRKKKTETDSKVSANQETSAANEENGTSVAEGTDTVKETENVEKETKAARKPRSTKKAAEASKQESEAAKEAPAEPEKTDAGQEVAGQEAAAKKPAKRAPKKAEPKKEIEEAVFIQYDELDINTKDILDKVKQAYVAERHRLSSIKAIRLYIKPQERKAYYVINDKHAGEISLAD